MGAVPPVGFERTSCACAGCVSCCKRQPGPLAPGDFERIAEFLGMALDRARDLFWASGGSVLRNGDGITIQIGSITPRMSNGRCIFLSADDRYLIHPVAPFGCAYFDTHMERTEGMKRGLWLAEQNTAEEYQRLRSELVQAATYKPTRY